MEGDLQSLFGLHVTWCEQLYSLAETLQSSPHPPALGLVYESATLVSKDRRHLFVIPPLAGDGSSGRRKGWGGDSDRSHCEVSDPAGPPTHPSHLHTPRPGGPPGGRKQQVSRRSTGCGRAYWGQAVTVPDSPHGCGRQVSVAVPGSLSRIQGQKDSGSSSKYFNQKKLFLSSRNYDPGCSSRIRILIFCPSRIPDPGVKKDPQHCFFHVLFRVKVKYCKASLKITVPINIILVCSYEKNTNFLKIVKIGSQIQTFAKCQIRMRFWW